MLFDAALVIIVVGVIPWCAVVMGVVVLLVCLFCYSYIFVFIQVWFLMRVVNMVLMCVYVVGCNHALYVCAILIGWCSFDVVRALYLCVYVCCHCELCFR